MTIPTDLDTIAWDPAADAGVAHGAIEDFGGETFVRLDVIAGKTYSLVGSTETYFGNVATVTLYDANGIAVQSDRTALSYNATKSGVMYVGIKDVGQYAAPYDLYISTLSGTNTLFSSASYVGKANERIIGVGGAQTITLGDALEAYGGIGDDTIDGNGFADRVDGGHGNDHLSLTGSGSVAWGGFGQDYISGTISSGLIVGYGDEGNDVFIGSTNDTGVFEFHGGADADLFYGGSGADTLYGDDGNDAITGEDGADSIVAGNGNDGINGGFGTDAIQGGAGNDLIDGGGDRDTIDGGTGNDTVAGSAGADSLSGGSDVDTLSYLSSSEAVNVNLATGIGSGGDAEGDRFGGFEAVLGSSKSDRLTGSAVANTLTGNAGNDILDGAAGNDTLLGGDGKDVLTGGLGTDLMTGGLLADRFVFTGRKDSSPGADRDIITDFSHADGDTIDLSAIDANNKTSANDAFKFIGTAAFTHHAGELHFAYSGNSTTIVEADIDGNGTADLQIQLTGHIVLVGADFVL